MNTEWTSNIKEWDSSIRSGKGGQVARVLLAIKYSDIPRNSISSMSNLARRSGQLNLAARWLYPILDPDSPAMNPTHAEKAEYAAALIELGAEKEGLLLLSSVDRSIYPRVWIYECFALFRSWNYIQAIPKLLQFLKTSDVSPYDLLVAEINLVASLINEEAMGEAGERLKTLQSKLKEKNLRLLLGNSFELQAQIQIHLRQYKSAQKSLNKSIEYLHGSSQRGIIYAEKWMAFLEIIRNPIKGRNQVLQVTEMAEKKGDRETVRDCDRYLGMYGNDSYRFNKVYFGTPHALYREKLLKKNQNIKLYEVFHWRMIKSESHSKVLTLDIEKGAIKNSKDKLKPGQGPHKLLKILASDFYSYHPVGNLFSQLFTKEYFNPHTSQDRVQKVIQRLRVWLKSTKSNIEIKQKTGGFYLNFSDQSCMLVSRAVDTSEDMGSSLKTQHTLRAIDEMWKSECFKASELATLLKISTRSANRILQDAVSNGTVVQMGRSRNTLYKKAS